MNYEKFGIIVTFIVLLAVLVFLSLATNLAGLEIPSIIPETTPEPNPYYDWCFKMKIDC